MPEPRTRKTAAISDERSFVSAVLETVGALVTVLDRQGRIISFNRTCEDLTGYSFDEVRGKHVWDLFLIPEETGRVKAVFGELKAGQFPNRYENYWVTKSGERRLIAWSNTALVDKGGSVDYVVATGIDVTEARGAEEALRHTLDRANRSSAEAAALLASTSAILKHERFEDAARAIFDSCKELIGAQAGYIALHDEEASENNLVFLDAGDIPCTVDPALPMPVRGLRGKAYRHGKAVYDNDFRTSRWQKYMPDGHAELESVLFAPLVIEGSVQGLLGLANKVGGFTDDDARLAMAFADNAAVALRNSRLLESLRSSEEQFRSVAESAADAIIVVDARGKVIFWNRAARTIFGRRDEEVMGASLESLMPRRFRAAHRKAMKRVVSTGKTKIVGETIELAGLRRDGSEFPLELSLSRWRTGGSVFFAGVIRDISARKEAEDEVRRAKEFSENLIDSSADGIVALDRELRYTVWNAGMERMTGIAREDILGRSTEEALSFLKETGEDRVLRAVLRGKSVSSVDRPFRLASGKQGYFSAHYAPLRDYDGKVTGILADVHDITERKQAEMFNEALNTIGETMNSTLDADEIMKRVVVEAGKAMGTEGSRISLREGGAWVVRYAHGPLAKRMLGVRIPDDKLPLTARAAALKRPIVSDDTYNDGDVDPGIVRKYKLRSSLIVPLIVKDEAIGALTFSYHSTPMPFSDAQIDFARRLSASVSLALENARLYEQQHRIAMTLQEHLIQPIPEIRGLELGIVYGSAFEAELVGGDFYDVFDVGRSTVALLVGDVSGKGIKAAGLTETIRSSVRTLAYVDSSPSFVLNRLNWSLLRQLSTGDFATAVFMVLDLATGELRMARAGHPSPVICGKECGFVDLPPGLILGAFPTTYREAYLGLDHRETIVVYTDGLLEARYDTTTFGSERVLKTLRGRTWSSPQDMADGLLQSATDFARGRLSDDVAIVCVRLSMTA